VATMTTAWGQPDHMESSLLYAEMAAALEAQAEVRGVAVDHRTGVVHVAVHLPDDLSECEREIRCVSVQGRLADVVADAFAPDDFVLARFHTV
jgi:hypothetical protein